MSQNEERILNTNNDETCCSGINYTNNLLLSYDRTTGDIDTLSNEHLTFNNEKKAEEHIPDYAEFSPNLHFVAYNLDEMIVPNATANDAGSLPPGGAYNPVGGNTVRVIKLKDRSETEFGDRKFSGWLDTENILVQNYRSY